MIPWVVWMVSSIFSENFYLFVTGQKLDCVGWPHYVPGDQQACWSRGSSDGALHLYSMSLLSQTSLHSGSVLKAARGQDSVIQHVSSLSCITCTAVHWLNQVIWPSPDSRGRESFKEDI